MRILIVEDVLTHLQEMNKFLSQHGYEVGPDEAGHQLLKEEISRCFQKGVSTQIAKEATDYIRNFVKDFNPDLVLVDFELKEGDVSVNGKRFIETFVNEFNIIIVTGQIKLEVNNVLIKVKDQAPRTSKRGICWKHDPLDERFFELLLEEVKKFEEQPAIDPAVNFGNNN